MDLIAAKTKMGCGSGVALFNTTFPSTLCHLAPRLRCIILVSKPSLGGSLDLERISLRTVGRDNDVIMGGFD
ncbi:MAG: hypothetical protein NWQ37_17770, partial [Marivita lacus]|nr:hypothetical protein [Marivita lacus]